MMRFSAAIGLLALLGSCSGDSGASVSPKSQEALVIRVEGMQRGEGGKT